MGTIVNNVEYTIKGTSIGAQYQHQHQHLNRTAILPPTNTGAVFLPLIMKEEDG